MVQIPGLFEAILLIALGIGYVVLYFAKREEKVLQVVGYIVGSAIILLATLYLIGNIYFHTKAGFPKQNLPASTY
jgi:hypothetical protein